jgi:hypothetical protein
MALTKIGATLGGSADVIQVTQSSHGLSLGYPVKVSGNGTYAHATADSATNAEAIGIIIATTTDTMTIALGGRITVDGVLPSGNLVAGTVLFLHTSAGKLTATEPSGNNEVSKPMAVITYLNSEMIMIQQRGEVITTGVIDSHTVASHSDTTGTGPELDELTDGSTTALHAHASSVAIRGGYSSIFETAGRFDTFTSGGTVSFNNDGAVLDSTGTTNRYAGVKFNTPFGENWLEHNVSIAVHSQQLTIGTHGEMSMGFGALPLSTASITMTADHFHFHLSMVSSSVTETWSQADGTTETSAAVASSNKSQKFLYMKLTAGTNVKYYSDGVLESTLTSNMPDDTSQNDGIFWAGVTNNNQAQRIAYRMVMFQVEVDLA